MNISAWVKNNRFLTIVLILAFLNMMVIFTIFGFQQYGDSPDYIKLIHWFLGEENSFEVARILRPLGPFLAVPFEFLGDGAGLIVQNIFFYFLSIFLIFRITELVFQNKNLAPGENLDSSKIKKQAFFASLFFMTATPVIESGLAYLTDSGAWFFYLLSLFLTLLYLKNKNGKLVILNGFLSGLGFLMKENGGLGAVFFGLMILFSREFNVKEKIIKIMKFGAVFLIPVIALQFFAYQQFHYTTFDWYLKHSSGAPEEGIIMTLFRYFGQLFRILGILWIFFLLGLWREFKEKNWPRIKIFSALVPASLSFFFWEVAGGGRAAFIFAPLGILLASHGLIVFDNKLGKKKSVFVLTLIFFTIAILNYCFAWFNPTTPFADIIARFLGII